MTNREAIFRLLSQCLTGAPFVTIGTEFFNLLAIESASYFANGKFWMVELTNRTSMRFTEREAPQLIESFGDAPFMACKTNAFYAEIGGELEEAEKAFFNYGAAARYSWREDGGIDIYLISGKRVLLPWEDVDAFKASMESALVRAKLAVSQTQRGGKR